MRRLCGLVGLWMIAVAAGCSNDPAEAGPGTIAPIDSGANGALDGQTDGSQAQDAGATPEVPGKPDAGAALDVASGQDTTTAADAGPSDDGGATEDAAIPPDAAPTDAGTDPDVGEDPDTAGPDDAGPDDAGTADAGTDPDATSPNDAAVADTTPAPDAASAPDTNPAPDTASTPDANPDATPDALAAQDTSSAPDTASGTDATVPVDGGTACAKDEDCVGVGDPGLCQVSACVEKVCAVVLAADGALCEDGDKCTGGEKCSAGKCGGGQPLACDDGNLCTDDSCDVGKGCAHSPNTDACEDGDKCTDADACAGGKCAPGKALNCDDASPCTTDSCDPKAGCVHKAAAEGSKCADASACASAALCKAGKCVPGTVTDCSDGNPCTDDGCNPKSGCAWTANTAPCEDGDKCTAGDKCANGACKAGAPVVPAVACDDKNPCTTDTCNKSTGCVHTPNTATCDDGNKCTKADVCKAGKCAGDATGACDDGKVCTVDNCDKNTGACSWGAKTGPCEDGDACTTGDACKNGKCEPGTAAACDDKNPCTVDSCDKASGKCVHTPTGGDKPLPCDDGDKCTSGDVCTAGKCVGGGAPTCDDGNSCTDDACDPATGTCGFVPNKAPCDTGDKCTWGDTCGNGKCVVGTNKSCDDGSVCTIDACDAQSGKCTFKPAPDNGKCDDGLACSTGDVCKSGKCQASDVSQCALLDEPFDCGKVGPGWQLEKPNNKNVLWAFDATPSISGASGCSLNFNNGKDYCDKWGQGCQTPSGYAWSPIIDASGVTGPVRVQFRTWYELDDGYTDRPRVYFIDAATNQTLHDVYLTKTGLSKQWNKLDWSLSQLQGKKFRIRFGLSNPSGQNGNEGVGWFVDDLVVSPPPPVEICGDGKDNDGNGKVDCADLGCKGKPGCLEVCTDGKDNDLDDAIDCKDSDCANDLACMPTLLKSTMDCGQTGWIPADMKRNEVRWAIDASPATPAPVSGKCTLNFNNGKNYCGVPNCTTANASNANAGTASWAATLDGGPFKTLQASYWSFADVETNENYDRIALQVSTSDFAECCGATTGCGQLPNNCNTSTTTTFAAPKGSALKKWTQVKVDLNKFAGKKFKVRYRLSTIDGQYNSTSGWFIDDLIIAGTK